MNGSGRDNPTLTALSTEPPANQPAEHCHTASSSSSSQHSSERAKNIIDNGQLSLDTKLGVFIVQAERFQSCFTELTSIWHEMGFASHDLC